MRVFNSRTSQLVAGQGAKLTAGLPDITAEHLASACQALDILEALLPSLVRSAASTGAMQNGGAHHACKRHRRAWRMPCNWRRARCSCAAWRSCLLAALLLPLRSRTVRVAPTGGRADLGAAAPALRNGGGRVAEAATGHPGAPAGDAGPCHWQVVRRRAGGDAQGRARGRGGAVGIRKRCLWAGPLRPVRCVGRCCIRGHPIGVHGVAAR